MAKPEKELFLDALTKRFGLPRKLESSQSLFEIADGRARVYVRYSKKHQRNRTFYGLRQTDLRQLEGYPSVLCFLWDGQKEPLLIPFSEFEEVFNAVRPATDGQFKAQVYEEAQGTELYIATAGRFNVESYFGWQPLDDLIHDSGLTLPDLTHSQVQTLLGAIGMRKGFDVWVPQNDRARMDWSIATPFAFAESLPISLNPIRDIVEEIDVVWVERGAATARAFFEVEHSTPIYSGLLRFNDVNILAPMSDMKFGIVCAEERRGVFVRQLSRPTFRASGLSDRCLFFEYRNVFGWHQRLYARGKE